MMKLQTLIPPLPWHEPRHGAGEGERVVLLHGLWRSVWAMEPPARYLNRAGFETLNVPYPSFRKSLDEIVDQVAESIPRSDKVTHFVTHSMGGIVLRSLAARYPGLVTGKVVMLAPPNQGSEIIDWLQDSWIGRWSLGPGGMSLSTGFVREQVPGLPEDRKVNVIMGRRSPVPVFQFLLKGRNDGIVTVESGRLPGGCQMEVVDADHTFIMTYREVLERVEEYLRTDS